MEPVDLAPMPPARFESVLEPDRYERFERALATASRAFHGRTLWNVNSTAKGGGVAEMLTSLLGYAVGAEIGVRWMVIDGNDDFFAITKRIHNRLHGEEGDGGDLGDSERAVYEGALRRDADQISQMVAPGDVAIIHDPQPAGLVPALKRAGVTVIWRCHVGVDHPNELARSAWSFLLPYVEPADICLFSRTDYAWDDLEEDRVAVIPPSIDAFSPKNQAMDDDAAEAILAAAGLFEDGPAPKAAFRRADGSIGRVARTAEMVEAEPTPSAAPIVLQVSRWDRLKDPLGVLRGFADHVASDTAAHLILAGPRASGVDDDPEQARVLSEVRGGWERLPGGVRRRVHLACLPMDDPEENGAIVNALQRRADVVVQKSLAEGFGLTVAEAMWKSRPTVASSVGGIKDQISHGESGLLIDDPEDLHAFGGAVTSLLEDGDIADRMGRAAHERVKEGFLAPRHLLQWVDLIGQILGNGPAGEG